MATINCDMGEGYGPWRIGDDVALMPLIDLANVACGFHAGDPSWMRATVRLAKRHGVAVGAHPSLPDRQGFGRREMAMGREELADALIYQIGALAGMLRAEGMALHHIKPHGALYGMAARLDPVAQAVCDAADVFGVPILGMPGTLHESVYPTRGHRFVAEFYADLDYADGGGLIITREHAPVDPALAAERCARALTSGLAASLGGVDVVVGRDSICLHSDTPNAVEVALAVRGVVR
ncbi:5-oxoprolinase subunit PxpA [Siccirubricoccus sp. KC 17139]|uniref:5-oxoprolinase subunit PxpA n=1 Tax=Siccirubricoccus soli TaxID=2899147 RepID=A0ABT1D6W0_9PROT|nr:5-oxoprolinase subunit PxpA [Siccirubricoccus soli]MCP2683781.1 5-oxoprolinase subunit PxpA [Siccirubricoccus soli]